MSSLSQQSTTVMGNKEMSFGDTSWCAMKNLCRNKHFAAPPVVKCKKCGNNVHRSCGSGTDLLNFMCHGCAKGVFIAIHNPYQRLNTRNSSPKNQIDANTQAMSENLKHQNEQPQQGMNLIYLNMLNLLQIN
jgi:hypothetical protein